MVHLDTGKIIEYLNKGEDTKVRNTLNKADIPDIAVLIDELGDKDKLRIYLLLATNVASEVLFEVSQHSRRYILKSMKNKYLVSIIEQAESDDSADILGEIPEHKVEGIVNDLTDEKKEAIEPLIKYEEDTAGGLMQSELIVLPNTSSVKEALDKLKKALKEVGGINYAYIVDKQGRLKGVVSMQDLIIAKKDNKLNQIMKKDVVKLSPELDKEEVAEIFQNEDKAALPVVDKNGKLLGRVTVDDVLDVMEEEATEDMFRMAGVSPDEGVFDPLRISMRKRLPWLSINLVTAMIAGFTVSLFHDTLQAVIILTSFMPIIAGLGGNSGTQTLALIVRGIALGQVDVSSYRKVLVKEVTLGMVNGMLLGTVMGVIAALWSGNYMIGVVVLLSMTINFIIAGTIATSVPFILKYFKIDPAIASSVFITASTDIMGFFTFLGISTLLLSWLV